jgi:hypothetical protein
VHPILDPARPHIKAGTAREENTMKVASIVVERVDMDRITACDLLAEVAEAESGYEAYHITPIKPDGYRESTCAQMIWHAEAGRAGIEYGANAQWTDASSPKDAAERFFGIDGKEMHN